MEVEDVWECGWARRLVLALSLAGPTTLASCGAGVAAVAASAGGSSGGSTPALNAFTVESPKVSPAFLVLDASQAVQVTLSFDAGQGQGEQPMNLRGPGVSGSEVSLAAGPNPAIEWDFASDLGGVKFQDGVRLFAKRGGALISGGELTLGMGNDPPEIPSILPVTGASGEAEGNVEVALEVSDSSSDLVSILVDWRRATDSPNDWKPATVGGVPEEVGTSPTGVSFSFFWKTEADGLGSADADFLLRVTADDGTLDHGESVGRTLLESPLFRVDNNAAPIVQLQNDLVISNPDERRGIPIPFRVIDEEGDLVEVIFQWRHEGEDFPSLDDDGDGTIEKAELDAILADPVLRQEHHICTEYPHFAHGLVVPIDDHTVRLPELARSESWILASGIVGKTLELLRPSSIPAPITPTWRSNPLVSPIAALPVGDGLTSLVLDIPGQGRLREIELATGTVVREIATLAPGIPTAMAFEKREKAVLVALDDAGTWRIERIELASGAITELTVSDGTEPAPVRGIASLGTNAAVFTAGSSLFHLDYRDPLAPQLGRLLTDLATPWSVVVHLLSPDRIYVSERDANRVLAIDLDSHGKLPVVVKTADMLPGTLQAPEALALEHNGSRLLAVTNAQDGGRQLEGLDLGAIAGNVSFSIDAPMTAEVAGVATGPDGLRLLCLPTQGELFVAGGIEQRREIAEHSTSTEDVSVEHPLDPAPISGQPWRVAEGQLLRAGAQGVASRFVWDSRDAPGSAFLRGLARDDEVGTTADGAAPKRVRLEGDPIALGGPGVTSGPASVTAADLDGDGDQDLVSANEDTRGNNLTVFFQLTPGSFAAAPLALGGPGVTIGPRSVAAADLDGDGDQDLVSANRGGDNLTVFLQLTPGSFSAAPLSLGDPTTTDGPRSVAAADLDGDGDQDLVSANQVGNNLTVFFQLTPGSFSASPLALGGPGVMIGPASVAVGDLDGDGDQDLVSANGVIGGSSNLTVFFQLTPGSFSPSPLVLGGPGVTNAPGSVAAADLDGDGDQDLVSANGSNLTVFFQLTPGSFSASPLALGGPEVTIGPVSVAAGDLDGDGDQDLVSANQVGNNLTVFFQVTPGSFSASPLALRGTGVFSVAAADLDGDGNQDLISANRGVGNLTVFFQVTPGSFGASSLALGGPGATSGPVSVAAADLDGDGDKDLVSANQGTGGNNLTVFFQLTPGSFLASPLAVGGPGVTSGPVSVAAADLDGDGDPDLVSANGSNLTVFFQLTPGSFSASPLALGTRNFSASVAAADLDGDGDQDLVSATGGNLLVFFQLTPGSFSASPLALGGLRGSIAFVAAADLDVDGHLDLVSANFGDNNLTVFFQLTPGIFSASPLRLGGPAVTRRPASVAAADLDVDGDLDLVSANRDGNNLTAFFQLAPRSFSAAPLVLGVPGVTDFPLSIATADLDGDGDQDLVSANSNGSNLTAFFQLTPGSFSAAPLALGGPGVTFRPVSVAAADLDGDGDQDLVSANIDGSNLTVFFGGR